MEEKNTFLKIKYIYKIFFKRYRLQLITVFILLLVLTFLGLFQYYFNQYLIDSIILENDFSTLFVFLCIYFSFSLCLLIMGYLLQKLNIIISQKSSIDIRMLLMNKIQKSKLEEILKRKSSSYLVRLMDDVATITGFYNNTVISNITTVLTIFMMLAYVFYYSGVIALVIIITLFLLIIISLSFSKKFKSNKKKVREVTQTHLSHMNKYIHNIPLIKVFNLNKKSLENYKEVLNDIKQIAVRNFNTEYLMAFLVNLISILSDVAVIVIGCILLAQNRLTVGVFVVLLSLSMSIREAMLSLAASNVNIQSFLVSVDRIVEIIDAESDYIDEKKVFEHKIEKYQLTNVNFGYDDNKMILNNACVELSNKKINLLQAESGVGKSTLANLMLQLYECSDCSLMINDIAADKKQNIRDKISICFQDTNFIFDTVYENLSSCTEDESKIKKVLEILLLDELIYSLSDGLHGEIGSLSNNFSGGEMQRLSMAMALLKDADIYIFDEAFSAVSETMKRDIFQNIKIYLDDRIILVITHDYSFLREYDLNKITL